MTAVRPAVCERSRSYASLSLDGELAELEQRMLTAHLAVCGPCRESAEQLQAVTAAVRATPLEPFEHAAAHRFRRGRTLRLRPVAAVAASVLVAVGAAGTLRQAAPAAEERRSDARTWPVPRAYLSDRALISEQQHILMGRPGSPPVQRRF